MSECSHVVVILFSARLHQMLPLTWLDVMAAVCWFCSSLWFSMWLALAAADSGRMTQIRSPETMPQDDRVWPASNRSSEPFRDKLNSASALREKHKTLFHFREVKSAACTVIWGGMMMWKKNYIRVLTWVHENTKRSPWCDRWAPSNWDLLPVTPPCWSAGWSEHVASYCTWQMYDMNTLRNNDRELKQLLLIYYNYIQHWFNHWYWAELQYPSCFYLYIYTHINCPHTCGHITSYNIFICSCCLFDYYKQTGLTFWERS